MPNTLEKIEQTKALFKQGQHAAAFDQLQFLNVADQAKLLTDLDLRQQVALLPKLAEASQVFEFLGLAQQVALAEKLPISVLVKVLDAMHSDDFIDLFKRLPFATQQGLARLLSLKSRRELQQLSGYAEGTAGAMMSSNFVTLSAELTMDLAIATLRRIAVVQDTLYLIYIVNEAQQLIGVISLRQIIQAAPDTKIADVMMKNVISAYVQDDQESIAKTLAYYDFIALPIVDVTQKLVGIVTYDDAMDIVEAETTEDILKGGAVSPLAELSLKTTPILSLYKKRVFWLVFLVFGSLLSGIGIAHYEETIATHIVLVFFLPLLVGSGGNAGSQSATLMVRGLATGDVHFQDWLQLFGRESLVAFCLGATMACAVSVLGYLRGDFMVALVLAISMMGIVLMGCLIGMSLPFILKRLNMDPASASAPLVTSICDATGVVVYLFIASQLLF